MIYFLFFISFLFPIISEAKELNSFSLKKYTITTFPDLKLDGFQEQRIVKSYHQNIAINYPVDIAPLSQIQLYVKDSRYTIYINKAHPITIIQQSPKWLMDFSSFRISLTKKIIALYPRAGALIVSLVLGNRYFLDDDFMEYVRASGLAHLFALSGLHLVIFTSLFIYMGFILGINRRKAIVLTLPISLFYLLLGGLGISLQRAFLSHVLWGFFIVIRIPVSAYKICITTLILHLLLMPQNIYSLSFFLSYGSIIGIVFFYRFWYDKIQVYIGDILASYIAISISVVITIAPILVWSFHFINIWSIFSSLFIVPLMPSILVLCFVGSLLSVFNISWSFLDILLDFCYQFMYLLSACFSKMPYGVIYFSSPKIWAGVLIIPIIILIISITRKNNVVSTQME